MIITLLATAFFASPIAIESLPLMVRTPVKSQILNCQSGNCRISRFQGQFYYQAGNKLGEITDVIDNLLICPEGPIESVSGILKFDGKIYGMNFKWNQEKTELKISNAQDLAGKIKQLNHRAMVEYMVSVKSNDPSTKKVGFEWQSKTTSVLK